MYMSTMLKQCLHALLVPLLLPTLCSTLECYEGTRMDGTWTVPIHTAFCPTETYGCFKGIAVLPQSGRRAEVYGCNTYTLYQQGANSGQCRQNLQLAISNPSTGLQESVLGSVCQCSTRACNVVDGQLGTGLQSGVLGNQGFGVQNQFATQPNQLLPNQGFAGSQNQFLPNQANFGVGQNSLFPGQQQLPNGQNQFLANQGFPQNGFPSNQGGVIGVGTAGGFPANQQGAPFFGSNMGVANAQVYPYLYSNANLTRKHTVLYLVWLLTGLLFIFSYC